MVIPRRYRVVLRGFVRGVLASHTD
jgi:hypothetical protein